MEPTEPKTLQSKAEAYRRRLAREVTAYAMVHPLAEENLEEWEQAILAILSGPPVGGRHFKINTSTREEREIKEAPRG